MKKVLAIAILGTLTLASCKKDRTCECVTTNSADATVNIKQTTTINGTKSDAEAACNEGDVSVGTLSTACELK